MRERRESVYRERVCIGGRGSRVAGLANARITDAGIADAGFASQEWQTRE